MPIGYRSISEKELFKLLNNETIEGKFNNTNEKQNNSSAENIIAFFDEPIKWEDYSHKIMIQCKFNKNKIIDRGIGIYYASDKLSQTAIWTGRRGSYKYALNEFYVSSYDITNVIGWINTDKYKIKNIIATQAGAVHIYEAFNKLNLPEYDLKQIKPKEIKYTQDDDTPVWVYHIWMNKAGIPGGIIKIRMTPNQMKNKEDGYYFKTNKEAEKFLLELNKRRNEIYQDGDFTRFHNTITLEKREVQ